MLKANHEQISDKPHRMIVPVETGDELDRMFRVIRDVIEVQILGRNQPITEEMLADVFIPRLPIRPARTVHQHQGHDATLACLHKGQCLVSFIHGAESTGEEHDGVGVPDESQLAGEEVFEGDQLFVVLDDRVGALFPRQPDVRAEAALRSGTFVTRLHDSWAGSGNHHPTCVRYLPGEIDRLLVLLFGRGSAGGTEDGDFAGASVRLKQFEGVA